MLSFVLVKGVKIIMRNVKYLGFVGLGCALLLTGCGSGSSKSNTGSSELVPIKNILTCTRNEGDPGENQIGKYEFEFNSKNNEVIGFKYYYTLEVTDYVSDDEVEELKVYAKKSFCNEDYLEKCDVSFENNILEIEMNISPSRFDEFDISGTKDEIKKMLEDDGASCK